MWKLGDEDTSRFDPVQKLEAHKNYVTRVMLSPDAKYALSLFIHTQARTHTHADVYNTLVLYARVFEPVQNTEAHINYVTRVILNPYA